MLRQFAHTARYRLKCVEGALGEGYIDFMLMQQPPHLGGTAGLSFELLMGNVLVSKVPHGFYSQRTRDICLTFAIQMTTYTVHIRGD